MMKFLTRKISFTRSLFFAVGVILISFSSIILATSSYAETKQINDLASDKVSLIFKDKSLNLSLFSPIFLEHVPAAQLDKIITELKLSFGTLESIDITDGKGFAYFEKAKVPITIALDHNNQINTLWFGAPKFNNINYEETIKSLQDAAIGNKSLLIIVDNKPFFSENSKTPMAVGSTFKLLVLKAYEEAVNTGKIKRDEIIPLQDNNRSLPSGVLQILPANTPVNLEMLAQLMVHSSDNTATDSLIHLLKKSNIERYSPKNTPLLTTKEFFQLIASNNKPLRAKYSTSSIPVKDRILLELEKMPLPDANNIGKSATWRDVEWYMSADEICNTLTSIKDAPALNSSFNPLFKNLNWQKIGFKGGSEYGVINFSVIGKTPMGHKVCAVFTANGDEPQPESKLAILFTGLLQAIDSIKSE